jgi:hypothetical protein
VAVRAPEALATDDPGAGALFFLVPLLCSFKFSLINAAGSYSFSNYTEILKSGALR